ncbi:MULTISPECIES: GyrI-like domain-containing protein [unclassified Azospirillum]|uniref:AraC family transcriptional regulator n=1 Tax=unclassified Azospirillum TaxID=2630922 RepID=UPI000B767AAF|nr:MULTISPECIES: AraC family transcriptional regulator [unclassified Azospirillum]SNS39614.1 transcriptional regulator, AraC family [Azospirillum sp. RU38E]SNS58017.1 transcriptional regulator, AraC family [Azospirillum sp. RU37A]
MAAGYSRRMARVIRHIHQHLDGDLSLTTLAGIAAFSPFHFHRQFAAHAGMTLNRYVQRVRLKRAAHWLAFRPGLSITQVALECGYASPESFSRLFRQTLGQSPSAFRTAPDWAGWRRALAMMKEESAPMTQPFTAYQVRLVDFPATRVAFLRHQGDPALIGDSIRRFIAWRQANRLPPAISATFNIFHDDPDSVAPDAYRLDICAAITGPLAPNAGGVAEGIIQGGPCAVLRQVGAGDDLRAAARFLYRQWLPASGREARGFPLFAQRLRFFPDVAEDQAVTDLFLPLTAAA